MAISNCLFSPTSENPSGFSVRCVLAKLTAKPRNYSQPRPLALMLKQVCGLKKAQFGFRIFFQNFKVDKSEKLCTEFQKFSELLLKREMKNNSEIANSNSELNYA